MLQNHQNFIPEYGKALEKSFTTQRSHFDAKVGNISRLSTFLRALKKKSILPWRIFEKKTHTFSAHLQRTTTFPVKF